MPSVGDEPLEAAAQALGDLVPPGAVAIILGSGLGGLVAAIGADRSIPYGDVPGFPRCRVPGHAGVLHLGRSAGGRPVALLEGRVHLYEGATVDQVTFAVRLLARLGVRAVVLTSAAGAVNPTYEPGELAFITDHINLTGQDTARRLPFGSGEPLFPSRARVYDREQLERLSVLAFALGVRFRRGVLAAVPGPSYETAAEARALHALGADVVCMSTVIEALAASEAGLSVLAIAVVTNRSGDDGDHERVLEAAARGSVALTDLVWTALDELEWGS